MSITVFSSSQHSEEGEMEYVNMEGYMEKLPINKKKATLLKTWKRRFFKAEDGAPVLLRGEYAYLRS